MPDNTKPNFKSWDHAVLADLTHDLWDNNVMLREANEQLRNTNKDLSALLRNQFMQEDDLR